MIPSNPTNQQPFIYRVADAAGVFHLVAPVDHTHTISEVAGLESALSTINTTLSAKANASEVNTALESKANASDVQTALEGKQNTLTFDSTPTANSTNPVTSGGVKAALDGKAEQAHTHSAIGDEGSSITVGEGEINIELSDPVTHSGGELNITVSKLPNLLRAINNPDTAPTANSTNLVTSGGVKAALDGKPSVYDTEVVFMEEETPFIYLPDYFTNGEKQKTFIMDYQGASTPFADIFYAQNTDIIRILSHDDEIINITECFLSFRVIRQANGIAQGSDAYYVIFDGKNEY